VPLVIVACPRSPHVLLRPARKQIGLPASRIGSQRLDVLLLKLKGGLPQTTTCVGLDIHKAMISDSGCYQKGSKEVSAAGQGLCCAVWLPAYGLKTSAWLIEREKRPAGDAEVSSVERKFTLSFACRDPGKAAQIVQALDD
jgi:hypothetical protein